MNVERTSSAAPEVGHQLLLELGRGGTAQVFLAVQSGAEGVDKLVVLKFLRSDLLDHPEMREMFINEARFSARLNHANIVQTSAIVQTPKGAAIVMEYLEGQPLSSLRSRARTKLPLEMHLRIIIDALRGLHYAHELTGFDGEPLRVVHRDVSPHNIFVTYDGQVKLIDFGIAKRMDAGAETVTGVIKGKIGYMPPEQLEGNRVDRRADLYAVGVMLWEAATGERMWRGMTDVAIMTRVLNGDIRRPRDVNPGVPEDLERIIVKTLSFSPEDRYATASELEADLEAFAVGLTTVTNRDIGRFVSREFDEVRAQTRRVIAQEMKRRASMARSSSQTDVTLPPPPPLSQSLSPAGYTTTGSDSRSADVPGPASRSWLQRASRPLLIAAVLGIGAGVFLGATTRSSRTQGPSADAAPSPAAPQPSPAAPQPSPLPAAPAAAPAAGEPASPPRDEAAPPSVAVAAAPASSAEQAEPPAERAGPAGKRAQPSAKQTRASAKQGASPANASSPGEADAPPAPAANPAPASPPSARCDPPYTIDADGIKQFKVECM